MAFHDWDISELARSLVEAETEKAFVKQAEACVPSSKNGEEGMRRACQEFCVIEFLFHSLTLSAKTMENWLRASPQFLIG